MRTESRKGRDHRLQEALKASLAVAGKLGSSTPSPKMLRDCAGQLRTAAGQLETLAEDYTV